MYEAPGLIKGGIRQRWVRVRVGLGVRWVREE